MSTTEQIAASVETLFGVVNRALADKGGRPVEEKYADSALGERALVYLITALLTDVHRIADRAANHFHPAPGQTLKAVGELVEIVDNEVAALRKTAEDAAKYDALKTASDPVHHVEPGQPFRTVGDSIEVVADLPRTVIRLNGAEIQSGHDRVRWAEGLVAQLPAEHDGRNTWLLNFGVGVEAARLRARHGTKFNERTRSAETVGGG